jgi:hypothetical protein
LYNGALIFFLIWVWRARFDGTRYRLEDLLPGRRGLVVWSVLLGLFYLVTGATLRIDWLPGPAGHVAMGALYVALGAALFRCRNLYHEAPSLLETVPSRSMPWRSFLAFVAIYGTVTACTRLALGQLAVAFLLVDWAVGGLVAIIVYARAAYSLRPGAMPTVAQAHR